jgi:uncharacterized cupin superfamily protein
MSPILIRITSDDDFTPASPVTLPISEQVSLTRVAQHKALSEPMASTGFWECTPGVWHRQVLQAEYSYFISGEGSFTATKGECIEFKAGDALFFPANSTGVWNIRKTVKKAYFIIE